MTLIGTSFGGPEVSGIIAVGVTADGAMTSGLWIGIKVLGGTVRAISGVKSDPPVLLPAVAKIDDLTAPTQHTVLLRVAANRHDWDRIADGAAVAVMDAAGLTTDGDEAVFIRYMADVLELLRAAASELP